MRRLFLILLLLVLVISPAFAQVDEAVKLADKASTASPSWVISFIAGVFGLAIYFLARYFGALHERLSARLDKVQDDRTADLKESNGRLVKVIEDSNSILKAFTDIVGQAKHLWESKLSS